VLKKKPEPLQGSSFNIKFYESFTQIATLLPINAAPSSSSSSSYSTLDPGLYLYPFPLATPTKIEKIGKKINFPKSDEDC